MVQLCQGHIDLCETFAVAGDRPKEGCPHYHDIGCFPQWEGVFDYLLQSLRTCKGSLGEWRTTEGPPEPTP